LKYFTKLLMASESRPGWERSWMRVGLRLLMKVGRTKRGCRSEEEFFEDCLPLRPLAVVSVNEEGEKEKK
jgi:hypothetical protein